jgi:hypothetical protein
MDKIIKKGITFGIVTSKSTENYLEKIIESIRKQKIPTGSYEILIVGDCSIPNDEDLRILRFDESHKRMWITKKKNLISEKSQFEIIVYMHDYLYLSDDWYSNFLEFGTDWDICMNQLINEEGDRILDWMGLPDDKVYGNVVLPYDYPGSSGMYIPGYFWICKRSVMLEFPLNEEFVWGEGEDIEWSKRVLGGFPPLWLKNIEDFKSGHIKIKSHRYSMNKNSIIKTLKRKYSHPNFFYPYDTHSGNESRPMDSTVENYEYLKYRK